MIRAGRCLAVLIIGTLMSAHLLASSAIALPQSRDTVLLISQTSNEYPTAATTRAEQVLMLLRHFVPGAELVTDDAYAPGMAARFGRVVVLGNDATRPVRREVVTDLSTLDAPVLWVGYGLAATTDDPDSELGFAPGFVTPTPRPVEVEYRGQRFATSLDEYQAVRVADLDVRVLASLITSAGRVPLAVQRGDRWFFGTLPGLDTDYPDSAADAPTLIFADVLHDFFGTRVHEPPQAFIRLEDVSAHIPPGRIVDAVDALARRGIPFVVGVIPAQRLADGSVLSIADRPDFVQALRYAQDRGGTIALHGYHHTFGQGEDFEFWDAAKNAPLDGEQWGTYALKVEDGIRVLRDQGIEPRLWETPHYAASPLAYQVFAHYFSHAIENRDPVVWLPYPSGPDPYGQMLIPENLGYINEPQGWTVDAQLQRASLLRIVRDATAVGFYHPASIPVADLERLVDGLHIKGYVFGDARAVPSTVAFGYEPDLGTRLATAVRIEPGLTVLEMQRAIANIVPFPGDIGGGPRAFALSIAAVGVFLVRLRAQWRAIGPAQRSRVEGARGAGSRHIVALGIAALAGVAGTAILARQTILAPSPVRAIVPVETVASNTVRPRAETSSDWEISVYFTAVESFYSGAPVELRGCPTIDCANGSTLLGRFPRDFVAAVKEEGSGRITSDRPARYLNWSTSIGYWLDKAPRDARGSILRPYVSAAADPSIDYVSSLRISDCGRDIGSGAAANPVVCEAIRHGRWLVRDRFTIGKVGKHVDLYLGEQTSADFVNSAATIHTRGASITVQGPPGP